MIVEREKLNKRHNLKRWREARLRRLNLEIDEDTATTRQVVRAGQLAYMLEMESAC